MSNQKADRYGCCRATAVAEHRVGVHNPCHQGFGPGAALCLSPRQPRTRRAQMQGLTHTHTHTHSHTHNHIHTHTIMYTHTPTQSYTLTHMYLHTHTHNHTHTHTYNHSHPPLTPSLSKYQKTHIKAHILCFLFIHVGICQFTSTNGIKLLLWDV